MPEVETGPSSRILLTRITPPTFLIVQPSPCPFSLWMVIRLSPPVSLVLFLLIGSFSSSLSSFSLAICTDRIHISLSSSELQLKLKKGFPSTIKLKQCLRFLLSHFSMDSMSIRKILASAVRPLFWSSSFLKVHSICRFKTTNRGRHCFSKLVFLWRIPSLMTLFFIFIFLSAMILFCRPIYQTLIGQNNAKNASHSWQWRCLAALLLLYHTSCYAPSELPT